MAPSVDYRQSYLSVNYEYFRLVSLTFKMYIITFGERLNVDLNVLDHFKNNLMNGFNNFPF